MDSESLSALSESLSAVSDSESLFALSELSAIKHESILHYQSTRSNVRPGLVLYRDSPMQHWFGSLRRQRLHASHQDGQSREWDTDTKTTHSSVGWWYRTSRMTSRKPTVRQRVHVKSIWYNAGVSCRRMAHIYIQERKDKQMRSESVIKQA